MSLGTLIKFVLPAIGLVLCRDRCAGRCRPAAGDPGCSAPQGVPEGPSHRAVAPEADEGGVAPRPSGDTMASTIHAAHARAAAGRAALAAGAADSDAAGLERLAARVERDADRSARAVDDMVLDYRNRAIRARRQAALARQWAEEAKDFAERALERAERVALAERQTAELVRRRYRFSRQGGGGIGWPAQR